MITVDPPMVSRSGMEVFITRGKWTDQSSVPVRD
jgi:hypothetical protein